MIEVPVAMPVTNPEAEPMVAMPVLPDSQLPPTVASASSDVEPTQALSVPVIGPGSVLTVTVVVTAHPVGSV